MFTFRGYQYHVHLGSEPFIPNHIFAILTGSTFLVLNSIWLPVRGRRNGGKGVHTLSRHIGTAQDTFSIVSFAYGIEQTFPWQVL